MVKKKIEHVKNIFQIISLSLIGILAIIFTVMYIETFNSGIFFIYSNVFTAISVAIITVIVMLAIIFLRSSSEIIFKIFFLTIIIIAITTISLYFLKKTGVLERFDSIDDVRNYISTFGNAAVILFILLQFLQVVVLPIPSFITVGAGVLLFGPFKGALFSILGIILGSITGFFIGKIFGVKVVKWIIGKKNLDKGLALIKGKDKIILTFMFLFPFFPDDILCFIAGMTTMSTSFFLVMIIVVRIITVFVSSYSMNNNIIPYDTWWGILLWIIFFIITVLLTLIIYRNGEKFEKIFKRKKDR